MASLGDVSKVMHTIGLWELSKRVIREVRDDHLFTWAAALAYSWLFAIFPFLVFLMSLLPYLPAAMKERASVEIGTFVQQTLPRDAADTIWQNTNQILERKHHGLLGLGLLLTLWGASGGMNMTISALDKCYEVESGRPFYKKRPIAVALTIVSATLVVAILLLLPIGTILLRWVQQQTTWFVPLSILRYPLAVLIMFFIVHVVYHWGPSIRQRLTLITPGGVFCVIVWVILGVGFRVYVDQFGKYNETYGTVGGVAVLLLLFYLDAAVLLIGAEINSEIDFALLNVPRGSRDFRHPRPPVVVAPASES